MIFSGVRSFALYFSVVTICSKATRAKPICDPLEPCKIGFLGLELCSCPNGRACPKDPESTILYENVKYSFCEPPAMHTCETDEVAWIRRGLRQTIHCKCPVPMRLTSEVWDPESDTTKYKCSKHRLCESLDDACMIRNRVLVGAKTMSLLKGLCQCPNDHECVETGKAVKAATTTTGLQQDIFQCVPEMTSEEEEQDEGDGGDGNDQQQLEEYQTTNRVNEQKRN